MPTDASAYAALGLEPGADFEAIERAYKRLIKQHHPDREGGNAGRAAEINRAYRELRFASSHKDALEFNGDEGPDEDRKVRAAVFLLLAAGFLAVLLVAGPIRGLAPFASASTPVQASRTNGQAAPAADAMDSPLDLVAIDGAVREAVRIARVSDEVALAGASRDCHRRLRAEPGLTRLDRCAAFDDAVIELQDRDPLRDRGPFSELAVTGRLMSGATLLSNDYLAIDGRLDRIRLHVELALAPPLPPPAASPPPAVTNDIGTN
jgi:hypothetical protein